MIFSEVFRWDQPTGFLTPRSHDHCARLRDIESNGVQPCRTRAYGVAELCPAVVPDRKVNTSSKKASIAVHDRRAADSWYAKPGSPAPSTAGLVNVCWAPP